MTKALVTEALEQLPDQFTMDDLFERLVLIEAIEQGRRDYALLLFLYNSGSRADEAAQLLISSVDLGSSSVKIHGKGGKQRLCPLWPTTVRELSALIVNRPVGEHVFLNRRNRPITRFWPTLQWAPFPPAPLPKSFSSAMSPAPRRTPATRIVRNPQGLGTTKPSSECRCIVAPEAAMALPRLNVRCHRQLRFSICWSRYSQCRCNRRRRLWGRGCSCSPPRPYRVLRTAQLPF